MHLFYSLSYLYFLMPKKRPPSINPAIINEEVATNPSCTGEQLSAEQKVFFFTRKKEYQKSDWPFLYDIDFSTPINGGKNGSIYAYKNDTTKIIKFVFYGRNTDTYANKFVERVFGSQSVGEATGRGQHSCRIVKGDKSKWWFSVQNRMAMEDPPVCPSVYEYGLLSDGYYVVQERIEGAVQLSDMKENLDVKVVMAEIIKRLESFEVCHNDLNSSNVIVRNKEYLVVDFDMATRLENCADRLKWDLPPLKL
jgi:RIO-like serine/threonine protein kinase